MKRIIIVGGGIIGLSIAYKLTSKGSEVLLIEKEDKLASHQSGRNSGVMHCGLSYKPGSLKALLARNGYEQLIKFCDENKIPYDLCGKLIVGNSKAEISELYQIGISNGLKGLRILNYKEAKLYEPNILKHKYYLNIPEEGIINYKDVCFKLKELIEDQGNKIILGKKIVKINLIHQKVTLNTGEEFQYDRVINSAGLHSDSVAKQFGVKTGLKIIPFGGRYYCTDQKNLFTNLIYPAPNIKFPFLGIHLTRTMNNQYLIGPNAMLRLSKEHYSLEKFKLKEFLEIIFFPGLWYFILKNIKFSFHQILESLSTVYFLKGVRDLIDYNKTFKKQNLNEYNLGIRAQAMNYKGDLIDDFVIKKTNSEIHVLNAPSPGATASLAIADYIIKNYCKDIK